MTRSRQSFATYLREMRQKAGVSLRQVARSAGITAPFLSDIELGRRMPSRAKLQRIAEALGIEFEEILKHDPREGLEDIVAAANTDPDFRLALAKLCRNMRDGRITAADVNRLTAMQQAPTAQSE